MLSKRALWTDVAMLVDQSRPTTAIPRSKRSNQRGKFTIYDKVFLFENRRNFKIVYTCTLSAISWCARYFSKVDWVFTFPIWTIPHRCISNIFVSWNEQGLRQRKKVSLIDTFPSFFSISVIMWMVHEFVRSFSASISCRRMQRSVKGRRSSRVGTER